MNASKKKSVKNTPVEKEEKMTEEDIIKTLDKKFDKIAELELRLKKVEERMGL